MSNDSGTGDDGWLIGGRYRVRARIGTGGMADVFRAHDEVLDRDVAVKVFRRVSSTPDTAAGAERQRTELQTLARLAHPNLITLFDGSLAGSAGDETSYLVMELIDGATLADAIERDAVSVAQVRAIGAQIGSALAYVHAANMVHRDVKPANILLGTDASSGGSAVRARLSDFGIVRLIGDAAGGQTGTQLTLGTASYLAPEQARGSSVGPPADVYALGLVLLEALTRTRAFDGPPLEAAMARLSRDPQIPTNLPAPWPQLIAAMTQRDPAARPTAQQVVDMLGAPDAGSTSATSVIGPPVLPPAPPTAATTAIPPGPPPGPVRRAPVDETRMMPPVPLVASTGAQPVAPASGPAPRRGLSTLAWLGIAAALVVLIIVVIALLASNGSGGGSPTPDTSSPSTRPASSSKSAPSTARRSSPTRSRSSSSSSSTSSAPSTKTSTSTSTPPTSTSPKPPTSSPPTSGSSTSPSSSGN